MLDGLSYIGMLVKENFLSRTPHHPAFCARHPMEWDGDALTAMWVGHATVLLSFHGRFILTDPVLVERLAAPCDEGVEPGYEKDLLLACPSR